MKVFGHPLSSCTRKVLMTLAEKGESAEFQTVDLFVAEHKASAHLARHPFGVVPVLDDGGFLLLESRAIIRYLDGRLGHPTLTPSRPRDEARMNQWLSVDQSYIAPHLRALAGERILKKHEGIGADPSAIRSAEGALGSSLAIVNRALGEAPYLAGESFSLADISLLPYVASLPMVGADGLLVDLPHLRGWLARGVGRDSWRRAIAIAQRPG